MLILIFSLLSIIPGLIYANGTDKHALFTEVLQDYVNAGEVNYTALLSDDRLQVYISVLENTNPDTITESKAQLAFWLNAYNAFTLQIILQNFPVKSINDLHWGGLYLGTVLKKTIWDKKFITIYGNSYSLNHIEHKIVRAFYDDARVHFALVCASKSCPPLRPEAYEASRLDAQLDDQARIFFSQPEKNHFDLEKQRAYLSKILDWFKSDFGANDEEILLFVAKYLPVNIAEAIKTDPKSWKIKHTKYDWSLNGF